MHIHRQHSCSYIQVISSGVHEARAKCPSVESMIHSPQAELLLTRKGLDELLGNTTACSTSISPAEKAASQLFKREATATSGRCGTEDG